MLEGENKSTIKNPRSSVKEHNGTGEKTQTNPRLDSDI